MLNNSTSRCDFFLHIITQYWLSNFASSQTKVGKQSPVRWEFFVVRHDESGQMWHQKMPACGAIRLANLNAQSCSFFFQIWRGVCIYSGNSSSVTFSVLFNKSDESSSVLGMCLRVIEGCRTGWYVLCGYEEETTHFSTLVSPRGRSRV